MTSAAPKLPEGVQRMVDATTAGDSRAFVDAFTEDGVVEDWGRTFEGHRRIAEWNDTENIGVRAHFDVRSAQLDGGRCTVQLEVSGGGFNGPSTFTFELDGPLIRRMTISG